MVSKLEIANKVFLALGLESESSLDSDSPQMRYFNLIYQDSFETLLSKESFSFALKKHELTPYPNRAGFFLIPSDCLKVQILLDEAGSESTMFEVRGDAIKTNIQNPSMLYISNTDLAVSPPFVRALVNFMAADMSTSLIKNPDLTAILMQKFDDAFSDAVLSDDGLNKFVVDPTIYNSRYGSI